jgi:2'-5' RNA ligase
MPATKHGFVLIPDRTTLNEAVRLSQSVAKNRLALDLELTPPHLTVLQTNFQPAFDYRGALKDLRSYAGFTHEPRTTLGEVKLHSTHSVEHILWWEVKNAEWLKNFNRELIEMLEGKIVKPEDADELEFASPAAEESYRKTGYERNLDAYEPHLTLAVTEEPAKAPKTVYTGEPVRLHKLAFVEHGELGELRSVLAVEQLPISWDW